MSDRILVGTRKGLFILVRQGGTWRIADRHFLGDPVNLVLHDPRDDHVYAALDTGHFGAKFHRSADGGATFEEVAAPAYPPKPEDEVDISAIQREEVEWKVRAIWALAAGGADEDGDLWCGTTPGGLFVSSDRGSSWELVRSLWDHPLRKKWFGGGTVHPALHSICVDPRDSGRVAVAVSCGGVWQTADHGETWALTAKGMTADYLPPEEKGREENQDPHCMVQCRNHPDHFWVQHHNGIFKSDDGARTWAEVTGVEPSSFGFPVVVHPDEPGTAWFVPAIKDQARYPAGGAVVVNRTRDGGASFTTLRVGLPQEHAYDLVFRHALALSAGGDRLAFGSTTGALWVSENQGDAFVEITAHLPPIYCVRFA